MKRVWQCDFCSHTYGDRRDMDDHEFKCSSNPTQKRCYSCTHYTCTWHKGVSEYSCADGVSTEVMWDVEDGDVTCDKWEKKY